MSDLRKELCYKKQNGYDLVTPEVTVAANEFCEDYKAFLDAGKTEREAAAEAIRLAKAAGFKPYSGKALAPGEKVYLENSARYVLFAVGGRRDLSAGALISAAHIDNPRLDLKPVPVYEDTDLCLLKTHYYGGIRKYQWVARPLALHGVVTLRDGTVLPVTIGEKEDDPVFTVTDLLPHLAQEQSKKPLGEAFSGENLNVLSGSLPCAEEDSERVKLTFLALLNSRYGITERDLITAELCIVPAGRARDVGLDRSLIGAYGQDDRVCGYTALRALLDLRETPEHTLVCALVDKEEIGSEGISGMQSQFFDAAMRSFCRAAGVETDVCYQNSLCLSADVSSAFDPNFPEAFDKRNSAILNSGVSICKYTGSRGKVSASDASSELFARIVSAFDKGGALWQSAELGRVDLGGGGTVAKYIASRGIQTLDCGTAVLSMHAPFEVTGKLDVYMTYRAFVAFNAIQ